MRGLEHMRSGGVVGGHQGGFADGFLLAGVNHGLSQ
jgi:hypothetical protein